MKFTSVLLVLFGLVNGAIALADEPPPPWNVWAAVSFSRHNGGIIGRAYAEKTEFMAKEAATRACLDRDCEIKVYVERGCIGIARGYEVQPRPLNWYGFGSAQFISRRETTVREIKDMTRMQAGESAKNACDNASHSRRCTVSETYCTWDAETGAPIAGAAVRDWIDRMGGETGAGCQNTTHLVNIVTQGYLINLGVSFQKASCLSARRWIGVERLALACSLTLDDLDKLYMAGNP